MNDILHSFEPVANQECRVLILGSMPGNESQRQHQYYAFKHNVFWRIMGELFHFDPALPYDLRLQKLLENHIALWDTLEACERTGSLDSNIRTPVPNDISGLLHHCPKIHTLLCNGTASCNYLKKYHSHLFKQKEITILKMPSTSPAAARFTYAEKLEAWRIVFTACREAIRSDV